MSAFPRPRHVGEVGRGMLGGALALGEPALGDADDASDLSHVKRHHVNVSGYENVFRNLSIDI